MQLVSFLFLVVVTIGVTIWLGRKKDWHAIFAIAPYSLFIIGIVMLNIDPFFDVPMSTIGYVEANGTWNAVEVDHTVTYAVDTTMLTIINIIVFMCAFFILFLGYEKLII